MDGVVVERKRFSIAVHYRKAREDLNRIMKQFKELIGEMEKSAKDLHGLE